MEQHTILKHMCTRWLSLERALDRLLEQWEPLVEYFRKESEVQSAGGKRKNDDQKQGELKKMKTASTSEVQPKKRTGVPVIAQASKSISNASSQSSSTSSLATKTLPASTLSHPAKGTSASGLSASSKSSISFASS